jgi:hypothetical protein
MADNNHDPTVVGGIQPIYCPQCNQEVKTLDSYQLSRDNKRYHYPECWQRFELGLLPTGVAAVFPVAHVEKDAPAAKKK